MKSFALFRTFLFYFPSSFPLLQSAPSFDAYGATLGGNLTPIGASANIAGIGVLRKEGYEVKTTTFLKFGVPFTLAAVMAGYLLVWFIWM